MKYIPLIIILFLILAILVLIFYGVYRVKRFSRQLFGTDDILQGVKKAQEDLSTTPRSVSAMTRIALPQIVSPASILVASHNPLDIEILCDEVYEMDAGAITKVH